MEMNLFLLVLASALAVGCFAEKTVEEAETFIDQVYKDSQDKEYQYMYYMWMAETATDDLSRKKAINSLVQSDNSFATYQDDIRKKILDFQWKKYDSGLRRKFFVVADKLRDFVMPFNEVLELMNLKIGILRENTANKIREFGATDDTNLLSAEEIEPLVKQMGEKDAEKRNYYWKEIAEKVAKGLKYPFTKYVAIENQIAKRNDYSDFGKLFQSSYEINDFEKTMNELFEDIKPFFMQLHAYVRHKLWKYYGENDSIINRNDPIPASLLGSSWGADAQTIYDQVVEYKDTQLLNITQKIQDKQITLDTMAKAAESFYTSLGLRPFPEDFWQHSILKETDGISCEEKVYYFKIENDPNKKYRLKLCGDASQAGHIRYHTWFGYIPYAMESAHQPHYFHSFPNKAFDFAYQDMMRVFAMSPDYLKKLDVLDQNYQVSHQLKINTLLREALETVFFQPFGLAWDSWRWRVADGSVSQDHYNCKYWEIRTGLQGVAPPIDRTDDDFDPALRVRYIAGAEHIEYFISEFLRLDMLRALCKTSGYYDKSTKPDNDLVFCNIYDSKDVGTKLKEMMKLGGSQGWAGALEKITGNRKLDSSAMKEFYEPLLVWLTKYNTDNNVNVGWTNNYRCQDKPNGELWE